MNVPSQESEWPCICVLGVSSSEKNKYENLE